MTSDDRTPEETTSTPNDLSSPDTSSPDTSAADTSAAPDTEASDRPSWGTASSAPPTGGGSDGTGSLPGSFATLPGSRFFDGVRRLGIVRPGEGRWGAGVALGIARRYGVDPVVVRIAFAVLTLLGGLGITLYGLAWLFLPHPDGRIHAQQVLVGTVTAGFVGALLTVLLSAHDALPLLLVGLVVFLIVRHRRTSPHRTAA